MTAKTFLSEPSARTNLENTLTKARDYCRRGVRGMPPTIAATATGYILPPFDRAMVTRGGTYPQVPNEAAWYAFPFLNRGSATDWGTLLIFCDPDSFMVHTYTDHWLAGFRLQSEEGAGAISLDTKWHLLHIEREMKGRDVPLVELGRSRRLPTGSGKTGVRTDRAEEDGHAV